MNRARCVVTYLPHPKTPVLAGTLEERTSRSSLLQKNWKESQTLLHVGLEQPIANWAKLGGTAWWISEEGKPGYSKVITHCARTREPLAHIEPSTPTS